MSDTIHLQPSLPGRHRADYGNEALTADLRVRKGRAPQSNGKHRADTNRLADLTHPSSDR